MKKLKSIDFKALFINHGEKFGLMLITLIVLVALGKTSWSRYAGTPEDLQKKAKDARDRFTSPTGNPWPKEKAESFKVVDFNGRAGQLFSRLDLPKYEFSTPLTWPLYRKREQAREPEYMTVEFVIANAGHAILGVSAAGTLTNSTVVAPGNGNDAAPAPSAPGTGFKSGATVPGPGAGGAATPLPGAPPAGGIVPPGAPMRLATGPGAHAGPGPGMMPGAMGGGSPSGVVARGVRYVAIRGVFPLRQQLNKYQSALNCTSADASTMFELLDFVLERQAAQAGPKPWDTDWKEVSVESALEVLRDASDFELDPVQTGVTDSVITMSLPYRLLEFWGDDATHPNVRDFQLKPEEMEREQKLQERLMEEYEKAQLQSKPKYERRGLSSGQNDLRKMGQEMLASPTAAHSVQNMMTNMAAPMTEAGGAPRMNLNLSAADIKQRLTANGRLLLFRYFDFDVQPGMAYRYRVKLKIRNPNFERPAAEVVSPELALGAERETEWSNISNPTVVPNSVNYFLKDVERDPTRDDRARAGKPVASISMFEWDTKLGTMLHDTLKIPTIGQFIAERKKTIVVDPAAASYKDDEEHAFLTGDVLLDAVGDFDVAPENHPDLGLRADKGRSSFKLGLLPEAVVMTGLGELKELNPASDRANEQTLQMRVDAERKEFKKLKDAAAQPGGAHGGAGANAYDAMMGNKTVLPSTKPTTKKSPKKKGGDPHATPEAEAMPPVRRSAR